MNIPPGTNPFLVEPDPSEVKLVNPGEYIPSPAVGDQDVDSSAGSVGAGESSRTDVSVVLRTSIPTRDLKGESYLTAKELKFIHEFSGNLVFTATTTTGELLYFEIDPHQIFGFVA